MLSNSKEKFNRDLKIYRTFVVILAIASIWIGLDLFSGEQCPVVSGLFLKVMVKTCSALGPKGALLIHVLLSVWLIYKAFSRKTRDKLAQKYT